MVSFSYSFIAKKKVYKKYKKSIKSIKKYIKSIFKRN